MEKTTEYQTYLRGKKLPATSMKTEIEDEKELDGELSQGVNKATLLKKHPAYDCGQEKNGILPWNNAAGTGERSRKNESGQQGLAAKHEALLPFDRSEASSSFLVLIEESDEDFETELSLFNELSISSDLVSSPEYLPYYRTYEELFINKVSLDSFLIQAEVEEGDIGREKREGGSGCQVNTIREDETLSNLVICTGYFPYYRSYEEHFGRPVLHDGLSMIAVGKEANTESNEKKGDICEVAVGCSDKSIPQSLETEKEAISSMPSVEPSGSLLLTNSIAENCGSEISLLNGLSILNQPFYSTGYFPYYRTYGELLISPASRDGYSSSTEAGDDVGSESAGKGKRAASVIVGHPLDTVKTRLQAGQGYGSTLNCILTVYRNESVLGFFKGMSFPLASIAIYSSVTFGVFSNTQRLISQHRYGDSNHAPAFSDLTVASMVAGVVSVGIGSPVDLIKIRLQMQTQPFIDANINLKHRATGLPAYRGPIHCVSSILRQEGLAGIYRGAGAMLLRDVPGYCLYFIPYTFLCGWITPDGGISPSPSSVWMAGGIAGAISWGTATPMDVVKSRLQADGVYLNKYKGVIDCISQSYHNEGLKVFFRGITVNAVRGFPMSAAMFLGYELSRKALRGDQAETSS